MLQKSNHLNQVGLLNLTMSSVHYREAITEKLWEVEERKINIIDVPTILH